MIEAYVFITDFSKVRYIRRRSLLMNLYTNEAFETRLHLIAFVIILSKYKHFIIEHHQRSLTRALVLQ